MKFNTILRGLFRGNGLGILVYSCGTTTIMHTLAPMHGYKGNEDMNSKKWTTGCPNAFQMQFFLLSSKLGFACEQIHVGATTNTMHWIVLCRTCATVAYQISLTMGPLVKSLWSLALCLCQAKVHYTTIISQSSTGPGFDLIRDVQQRQSQHADMLNGEGASKMFSRATLAMFTRLKEDNYVYRKWPKQPSELESCFLALHKND